MFIEFSNYSHIKNEIENISFHERKYYIFSYNAVLTAIDKILLMDLNIDLREDNPYKVYINSEIEECEKFQNLYPLKGLIKSRRELQEKTDKFVLEIAQCFYSSFPFVELFNTDNLGDVFGNECTEFEDYLITYSYAAIGLNAILDLDLFEDDIDREKNTEQESERFRDYLNQTNTKSYERTNDDTYYVDDEDEDFAKFKHTLDYSKYTLKRYESACEIKYYKALLRNLSRDYHLIAQVCLASIIDKKESDGSESKHRGELFRIIDFGIFDDNYEIKLLIEINDKTHDLPKTQLRDKKVQAILDKVGIKLIKFSPKKKIDDDYIIEQLGEYAKPELRKK